MRYISYAQEFEDIIIFSALGGHVDKGIYVDIGANDPNVISVTKFFYDRGWRGINIEPLDDKYRLLCVERMEDENINTGVSDENGELEFNIMGTGSTFSTTDVSAEKIKKPVKRFSDLWVQSKFYGKEVHFCTIDVEGYEKQVLNGIDFTKFRPWIFVIESVTPNTEIPCYDKWESILINNGYLCQLAHGANRYYVEKEKEFLIDGLVNFGNMFIQNDVLKIAYRGGYSDMIDKLDQSDKIALFGAGGYLNNFLEVYGKRYKPSIIVDNSVIKQGQEIFGIRVQSPDILKKYSENELTVLICCEKAEEIKNQLDEMNIRNYIEYCYI